MKKSSSYYLLLLVVSLAGYAWWSSKSSSQELISSSPLSNFEIKDTAKIDQIILQDTRGNKVNLTRDENNTWLLNEKHLARKDAVQLILKTAKQLQVEKTIPETAFKSIVKQLSVNHKKVDFYQSGELIKTYYVGTSTQGHQGTYMLLETPSEGKSTIPYIMSIPGFVGTLQTRFFAEANDWRDRAVFRFSDLRDLESIKTSSPSETDNFELLMKDDQFRVFQNNIETSHFDTSKVIEYVLGYRKKFFERIVDFSDSEIKNFQNQTPYYRIEISTHSGQDYDLSLFQVKLPRPVTDDIGRTTIYDTERFYLLLNSEIFLVRYTEFRKLMRKHNYLL